jgi:hypothetical protein
MVNEFSGWIARLGRVPSGQEIFDLFDSYVLKVEEAYEKGYYRGYGEAKLDIPADPW